MKRKKKKYTPKSKKKNIGKKTSSGLDAIMLKYLNTKNKTGVKAEVVYKHFLKKFSEDKITATLKRLKSKKKVDFTDNGKIKVVRFLTGTAKDQQGILDLAKSGAGYVKVEGFANDVYIPKKYIGNAMQNDTVAIELTKFSSRKPEGKITEVLQRNQNTFIGRFQENKNFGFVIPSGQNINFDIYIPQNQYLNAKDGDIVKAKINIWKDRGKNPIGVITEVLENISPNELEMQSILLENGFRINFSDKIKEETAKLSDKISQQEIAKRLDYRKVPTFTIDPKDAKDFDDALSLQKLDNGNYEIGVHIADVSHYVKPNSALDEEAQYRATSVYLPDRVIPMLPERISNELCSLRPQEEKLAFSVLFEIDAKEEIVAYKFSKTVIFSDKRFIYGEVQEILDGKADELEEEIHYLAKVARKIRAKRYKNGAINFDSEEVRFVLDENKKPIDVYVKERTEANLLVEDFMLLANTTVAKYLSKLKVSKGLKRGAVYRVHDKPSQEKLQVLGNLARKFGYTLRFEDAEQTRDVLKNLMSQIEGKPEMNILSSLAIRSMAKASYTTKNIGHYGLAFDFYTHFTSPIRRYPDVLVHRLLANMAHNEKNIYLKEELEELLQHASLMEKKAQSSERSATKYKQVEYLQKHIGETFEGIISGVINRGFFVELTANKCEGFVPLYQLDEEFLYDEENMLLKGLETGVRYQIGNSIKVVVEEANLKEKRIEFYLAEEE